MIRSTKVFVGAWLLLVVAAAAARAQVEIEFERIGTTSIKNEEITVARQEDVAGIVWLGRDRPAVVRVQLAWQRLDEQAWWIAKQSLPLAPSGRSARFRLRSVPLGDPLDDGARLALLALVTPADQPLPAGILDFATLTQGALALSKPILVFRAWPVVEEKPLARVRIDFIGGQPVLPDAIREVRLQETLQGEVRAPKGAQLHLVVLPLNTSDRWVMHGDPHIGNGRWSMTAFFGRSGLDEWVDFEVYAVLTREELPTSRAIPPGEWRVKHGEHLLAVSPPVIVRRVELPPPETLVQVVIHAIGNTLVDARGVWRIARRSSIRGVVTGRSLSAHENVWLLATPRFGTDEWRVLGKASVIENRQWILPPRVLGEPGEHLDIVAVLARRAVHGLSDEDIETNMPFARRVMVEILDHPPLEVIVEQVDDRPLPEPPPGGGRTIVRCAYISSLRGYLAGRPPQPEERVWILKRLRQGEADWESVGEANRVSRQQWALPPTILGQAGDELMVIAVVAPQPLESLNAEERAQVIAFSEKVHLNLIP